MPSTPTTPGGGGPADHSGYLKKLGGSVVRRNQQRWFELRGRELYYFNAEGQALSQAKGCVALADVESIQGASDGTLGFTLTGEALRHPYVLAASTQEEKATWVRLLQSGMRSAKSKRECADATFSVPADATLIRCCTWNVAELDPSKFCADDLAMWLTGKGGTPTASWVAADLEQPTLLCICLQEVDMSFNGIAADAITENVPLMEKKTENRKADDWRAAFTSILAPLGYSEISYGHEASVFMQVFGCDAKLESDVKPSAEISFWRGKVLKGLVEAGNKGSICARLRHRGASYCFVGSHLAAHPEGNDKRNLMYRSVLAETSFASAPRSILEHDYVYWLGDLNYRMTGEYYDKGEQAEGVLGALKADMAKAIQKHDQLSLSRTKDGDAGAFQVFHEAAIQFAPTYKLRMAAMPEATQADLFNIKSEAHHIPSYTDRILYYSRHCTPDAVMRIWRPPPLIVRKLPKHPDKRRTKGSIQAAPPHLPKQMGAIGVVCLDYSDTHVHTDHRQVHGLYIVLDHP